MITNKLTICDKPVNWFLIVAILIATFLPVHYHLHHQDAADSLAHTHVIDLHFLSGEAEKPHHEIGATNFTAVPDDAVKSKSEVTPFIFLAALLIIISVIQILIRTWLEHQKNGPPRIIPHFTPLLRAPPLK